MLTAICFTVFWQEKCLFFFTIYLTFWIILQISLFCFSHYFIEAAILLLEIVFWLLYPLISDQLALCKQDRANWAWSAFVHCWPHCRFFASTWSIYFLEWDVNMLESILCNVSDCVSEIASELLLKSYELNNKEYYLDL